MVLQKGDYVTEIRVRIVNAEGYERFEFIAPTSAVDTVAIKCSG